VNLENLSLSLESFYYASIQKASSYPDTADAILRVALQTKKCKAALEWRYQLSVARRPLYERLSAKSFLYYAQIVAAASC